MVPITVYVHHVLLKAALFHFLLQKRLQRKKALVNSTTFSEEEKEKIQEILMPEFMSSEESMSEDPSDRDSSGSDMENNNCSAKVLVVKKLPWRSSDCLAVLKRLDSRVKRKRSQKATSMVMLRRAGGVSSRQAPEDAPEWAVI
jgi:hypothetical protein